MTIPRFSPVPPRCPITYCAVVTPELISNNLFSTCPALSVLLSIIHRRKKRQARTPIADWLVYPVYALASSGSVTSRFVSFPPQFPTNRRRDRTRSLVCSALGGAQVICVHEGKTLTHTPMHAWHKRKCTTSFLP